MSEEKSKPSSFGKKKGEMVYTDISVTMKDSSKEKKESSTLHLNPIPEEIDKGRKEERKKERD